jgi:hypothetical protein
MFKTNCLATKFYTCAHYTNYAVDSQWSTDHQFRIINHKITRTLQQNLWL